MTHSNDPNHKHTYDSQGKITCCSLEEKINRNSALPILGKSKLSDESGHKFGGHDDHDHEDFGIWPAVISALLLLAGLTLDHFIDNEFFTGWG